MRAFLQRHARRVRIATRVLVVAACLAFSLWERTQVLHEIQWLVGLAALPLACALLGAISFGAEYREASHRRGALWLRGAGVTLLTTFAAVVALVWFRTLTWDGAWDAGTPLELPLGTGRFDLLGVGASGAFVGTCFGILLRSLGFGVFSSFALASFVTLLLGPSVPGYRIEEARLAPPLVEAAVAYLPGAALFCAAGWLAFTFRVDARPRWQRLLGVALPAFVLSELLTGSIRDEQLRRWAVLSPGEQLRLNTFWSVPNRPNALLVSVVSPRSGDHLLYRRHETSGFVDLGRYLEPVGEPVPSDGRILVEDSFRRRVLDRDLGDVSLVDLDSGERVLLLERATDVSAADDRSTQAFCGEHRWLTDSRQLFAMCGDESGRTWLVGVDARGHRWLLEPADRAFAPVVAEPSRVLVVAPRERGEDGRPVEAPRFVRIDGPGTVSSEEEPPGRVLAFSRDLSELLYALERPEGDLIRSTLEIQNIETGVARVAVPEGAMPPRRVRPGERPTATGLDRDVVGLHPGGWPDPRLFALPRSYVLPDLAVDADLTTGVSLRAELVDDHYEQSLVSVSLAGGTTRALIGPEELPDRPADDPPSSANGAAILGFVGEWLLIQRLDVLERVHLESGERIRISVLEPPGDPVAPRFFRASPSGERLAWLAGDLLERNGTADLFAGHPQGPVRLHTATPPPSRIVWRDEDTLLVQDGDEIRALRWDGGGARTIFTLPDLFR